ncbi:MAG: flagellar assembly protein FliW [Acidobacteriota bacterium]
MTTTEVMRSAHLGNIEWSPGCELYLPAGLPGFEEERRMIPVEVPAQRPLVFLQSLDAPDICFVSLPVRTIFPDYLLRLSDDDRLTLLFEPDRELAIGADVLCLALLVPFENTVQANVDAPVVINLHNRRCLQSLSSEHAAGYFRLADGGVWEPVC